MQTPHAAQLSTHVPTHDAKRVAPGFAALLAPRFSIEELDRNPASIFGLWGDGTIAYVNPAWREFGRENGGYPRLESAWGLGAGYLDAIAEPLRPFYAGLLERAADESARLHPVTHQYECSSARLFRKYSMQVFVLEGRAGFVIVNSLVFDAPHDPAVRPSHVADPTRYRDARGLVVQCAHCRRVRRAADLVRWDWVPAWVEQCPDRTSHGVCGLCLEYYYSGAMAA